MFKKVYYYGEFGYFNFIILGYLEEYFLKNRTPLIISTYDDYFKILSFKFPNKFIKLQNVVDVNARHTRKYHKIQDENFNKNLIKNNLIPLEKLLKCDVLNWKDARNKIKNIKNPILKNNQKNKKYISFLCRKRTIDVDRNLSLFTWNKIIKNIKKIYKNKEIIFHGLKEETISVDGDYIFCSDIIESIGYLNNSELFVSSMSGFAQFASNCACSILQIGPAFQMIPYNPFNKINIQIERENIENIEYHIKQQFLKIL